MERPMERRSQVGRPPDRRPGLRLAASYGMAVPDGPCRQANRLDPTLAAGGARLSTMRTLSAVVERSDGRGEGRNVRDPLPGRADRVGWGGCEGWERMGLSPRRLLTDIANESVSDTI